MKIADRLREIALSEDNERKKLAEKFRESISGHREQLILERCAEAAEKGQLNVMLGKKTLPPAELKEEGLKFTMFWSAIFCCWD